MHYNIYRFVFIEVRLYKIQRRISTSLSGTLSSVSDNSKILSIPGRHPKRYISDSKRKRIKNNDYFLTLPTTNLFKTYPMCMGRATATVMMAADGIISNHIFPVYFDPLDLFILSYSFIIKTVKRN